MLTIDFEDVGQAFYGRWIFKGINFSFLSGAVTAVTGGNGRGKSTVLRLAGKLLSPAEGSVKVCDEQEILKGENYRRRIALLTPELKFYPRLTAYENLKFLLELRGTELKEDEFLALLDRVELPQKSIEKSYVGEFSTGMKQRIKLAALIASASDVWLLDEPGANLDERGRRILSREIGRAKADGKIILLATNDDKEELLSDETLSLENCSVGV